MYVVIYMIALMFSHHIYTFQLSNSGWHNFIPFIEMYSLLNK